jgi:hypothetical protein
LKDLNVDVVIKMNLWVSQKAGNFLTSEMTILKEDSVPWSFTSFYNKSYINPFKSFFFFK